MKRTIKTFQPEADVKAMLERAESEGIKLVYILNEAARRYLTEKGYARKRDLQPKK